MDEKGGEAAEEHVEEGHQHEGCPEHSGAGEIESPGEDTNDESGTHVDRRKG